MKLRIRNYSLIIVAGIILLGLMSCQKSYLPVDRETVGLDSKFNDVEYRPVLGRTTYMPDKFSKGSTSYPAEFKIVNARRRNGDPAPELTELFPVKAWIKQYTGEEKSVKEIEDKREIQYRPLFEIGKNSGTFTMWAEAKNSFFRSLPDSGYLFDVEVSNSGGRRYFKDMKLMPYKERPSEPSTLNTVTGQPISTFTYPSRVYNVMGAKYGRYIGIGAGGVVVFMRKLQLPNTSNTLTFKFLDTLYQPINPDLFADTDWPNLVHGFNMRKTATEVTYDVAYPIPAIELPTKYTTPDGRQAFVNFKYSRLGFGGRREDAVIGLNFAIYDPGAWEIVFVFTSDMPKFSND